MSVKILHTADLHIGALSSYLGNLSAVRQKESVMTFEKIIDLCNEENTDLLLIAGDLFDSNSVDGETVNKVFEAFDRLKKTKAVVALGNHDPYSADSPFKSDKLSKNVFVLPTTDSVITFDELKARVYGSSFAGIYKDGEPSFALKATEDDYVNIMVLHGETSATLNGNYNPILKEFILSSGMDYIALGHIHKRTEILKLGNTYFAYPGCPEGQGFDETDEKGVYVGEIGKNYNNLTFRKTAKRTHYVIEADVTDCKDIYGLVLEKINEISEEPLNNLFKIVLKGEVGEEVRIDTNDLTARISEKTYFVRIKDKTALKVNEELLNTENSLKGAFFRIMKEKIETLSGEEKEIAINALQLGLKSFDGEVSFDEN